MYFTTDPCTNVHTLRPTQDLLLGQSRSTYSGFTDTCLNSLRLIQPIRVSSLSSALAFSERPITVYLVYSGKRACRPLRQDLLTYKEQISHCGHLGDNYLVILSREILIENSERKTSYLKSKLFSCVADEEGEERNSSSQNNQTDNSSTSNSASGATLNGNVKSATVDPDDTDVPLTGNAAKYGCPADSLSLGRGSWRLLHSMAAYYPEKPSTDQQKDMSTFITIFSKFYPCQPCAEDFREWLKKNTPDVSSQKGLSRWFCEAHNEVNGKLGKPLFDCNLVNQRWRDGWKDGSCD
ncbi:mitochondrial FAD-linked sulfhydryl oxidase ERV1-like [Penaeus japonicus]|uniref:mitochondrial FAD-linked sulfhydryl oxidase ERV1-like n=1 Tax=Penaeus japonicus TaxID=27405 RepID=UPI001C70C99F|nr:mitochondrial FAD-linked sulfhydryl oxidase ERV1-like [Penaeus japonicus]